MPSQFPPVNQALAFADGACSGNPGPGGWSCFLLTPSDELIERGGHAPATTNNRMELQAAIEILKLASERLPKESTLLICVDSKYVLQGASDWVWGWARKNWKTASGSKVLNQDLWEQIMSLVTSFGKARLEWKYTAGHSGIAGNERVDEIAVAYSKKMEPSLYEGPISHSQFKSSQVLWNFEPQ